MLVNRKPEYNRQVGKWTHKWCPECGMKPVVPDGKRICPRCSAPLAKMPKVRRQIAIHDLSTGLPRVMQRLGVSGNALHRASGLAASHIARLRSGEQFATPRTAQRLANALGVKVAHLTGEKQL